MIELFEPKASRSVMADWVELTALIAAHGTASWGDLVRSQQVRDEADHRVERDEISGEDLDGEITDSRYEDLASEVGDELQFRSDSLRELYPFVFAVVRGRWTLTVRPTPEGGDTSAFLTYKTCLFISGFRRSLLRSPSKEHTSAIADCMQRVAYLVAGEVVGGDAHWFGWPRPDSTTTMRTGLEKLVERLRHGDIKVKDPEWTSGHEKDAGVDIVAWRSFLDGRPGSLVLFGQVASGLDWTEKPVSPDFLNAYFNDWFIDQPSAHYLPATFIPFMQHDNCKPRSGQSFEDAAAGKARQNEILHGLVIDRLRLCELADAAEAGRAAKLSDERAVNEWFATSLQLAAA